MSQPPSVRRYRVGVRSSPLSAVGYGSIRLDDQAQGFTLLEVVTIVTLLALILGRAVPALGNLQDRMAVVGAREAAVGLFHRARVEAIANGGAILAIDAGRGILTLESGGEAILEKDLSAEYSVAIVLSRARPGVRIAFDAMGLGRIASQTVRFSRGKAATFLVISSYGRVTRR